MEPFCNYGHKIYDYFLDEMLKISSKQCIYVREQYIYYHSVISIYFYLKSIVPSSLTI